MAALNKKKRKSIVPEETRPKETVLGNIALYNIAMGIYAICTVVIVVFIISIFQVLNNAGLIADDVRAKGLSMIWLKMKSADRLKSSPLINPRYPIGMMRFRALAQPVDQKFVQVEIADWLWDDFAIENSIVVSADGLPVVMVSRGSDTDT